MTVPPSPANNQNSARRRFRWRARLVHAARVMLLAFIVVMIHRQHARMLATQRAAGLSVLSVNDVRDWFPSAESLSEAETHGGREVLDVKQQPLGFVIQTAPESDRSLGFSGSTNLLLAFDPRERLVGMKVLASGDTRDHVELIRRDARFLHSLDGLTWSDAAARRMDAVSGATLTSRAIEHGLHTRLGMREQAALIAGPLTLDDVRLLFPNATVVERDASASSSMWHVAGANGPLGRILRTSPSADRIIGYQGPTDALLCFNTQDRMLGVLIGRSFDNEPYVGYVREDEYFRTLFNEYSLPQLGVLDLKAAGVEGVSGATMTSMAVARGVVTAARDHVAAQQRTRDDQKAQADRQRSSGAMLALLLTGLAMSFTSLRGRSWFRLPFQAALIVWLGFLQAELLSLAMFAGWIQHGVPWQSALSLVLLSGAAVIVPVFTRQNFYCSHLCPHGAVQQLLARYVRWTVPLPPRLAALLVYLRPGLLGWAVLVLLLDWKFSLVDLEAFDAWSWRAAAWPSSAIAIIGLLASCFMPMAYCRFGCPTGAVLGWLRFHSRADRLSRADWLAAIVALVASVLVWR